MGAETPVLFDETDGIDFEAVADTDPDVILAVLLRHHPGGVRHPVGASRRRSPTRRWRGGRR